MVILPALDSVPLGKCAFVLIYGNIVLSFFRCPWTKHTFSAPSWQYSSLDSVLFGESAVDAPVWQYFPYNIQDVCVVTSDTKLVTDI